MNKKMQLNDAELNQKTKVQLNDMELENVAGGSWKSFWKGVKRVVVGISRDIYDVGRHARY